MKYKKVTITDIAKECNVSAVTVSNALRYKDNLVSEEKKREIFDVASRMGYLSKFSTNKVLVLIIDNSNVIENTKIFKEMKQGIEESCLLHKYTAYFHHTNPNDLEIIINRFCLRRLYDGVIVVGLHAFPEVDIQLLHQSQIPVVILDAANSDQQFDYIVMNNEDSTYELTNYLISKGHRHIGFITIDETWNNMKLRKDGYKRALQENHLTYDPMYDLRLNFDSNVSEYLMKRLQELKKYSKGIPSAYVAAEDMYAIELLEVTKKLNLHIDVTGYDDIEIAKTYSPTLTTVKVNNVAMGKAAVARIVEKRLDPKSPCQKIQVSNTIIYRESTNLKNK